jgi:hypothetical protein
MRAEFGMLRAPRALGRKSSDPPFHRGTIMEHVHEGQCGLCTHFGETHAATERIVQIRTTKEAPTTLVDECGHPRHASLHLVVTPISGCNGFEPARMMS